jgi:hypothetical protein
MVWCPCVGVVYRGCLANVGEANKIPVVKFVKGVTVQQSENTGQVSRRSQTPAQLANLEKRVLWGDQRKCARCKRPARRDSRFCPRHAGSTVPRAVAFGRGERQTLEGLERLGLLPPDLLATSVWRNLNGLPTSVRSPMRLRLVLLWGTRETEALAFAQAWRQALAIGKTGVKRNLAAWCDNR